jgi:HSP20 family molecular chaperone IbpA
MPETSVAVRAKEEAVLQRAVRMESLLDQMDAAFDRIARRAFELFEGDGRLFGRDLEHWFQAERELLHPVCTELTESDEAFALKAEVPGFNEKELEINVEPRRVVITGKHEAISKEEKKGKTIRSEIASGEIMRMVELPVDIETDKVTATLKNGVLSLALPKSAKARSVRVKPVAA